MTVAQTNIALYRQLLAAGWTEADLARVAQAHELAIQLFGGQFRGNGKPFVCHVVGTASILAAHGAATEVVIAGLLHAAYTHGDFGALDPALLSRRRRAVRAAAGEEVEALVAGYATMRWPDDAARIPPHLALLRLANEIEDHLDGALAFGRKPALAAHHVDGLVALAGQLGHAALGAQLRQAVADRPDIPAALRRAANGSFTPGKPARSLNRLVHRLRNYFLGAGVSR